MEYSDSVEKSAEYLGRALMKMAKQTAAMHPVSYAVWYEYVSGRNFTLNLAIDEQLLNGGVLDENITYDIYNKYLASIDVQIAQRFAEGFEKVMGEMLSSTSQASDQAGQFGNALESWCTDWASSNHGPNHLVDAVLDLTRNMQGSIVSLKGRLDASHDEIKQLNKEVEETRVDALTDGLSGLTNRRGFDMEMAACLTAPDLKLNRTSLIMADIDHFKEVNDTYGHAFGDKVIQAVAKILKQNVKGADTAARYGGEEFVVLLTDSPTENARQLAENIRSLVASARIRKSKEDWAPADFSVSFGVAGYRVGESAADFIARADFALYASKNAGRNRVTVAPT